MNGNEGPFGQMMRRGGAYGYSGHMHDGGASSIEWAILGVVIAILVVVLLLLADRCRQRRYHRRNGWEHHGTPDEPLTIVRARYARGELTRDEYLQSLDDLGAPPGEKKEPESTTSKTKPRRRRVRKQNES